MIQGSLYYKEPDVVLLPSLHAIQLELNFNIDASWEIQLHKSIDSLGGQVLYVYESLMGTKLELFSRILVHMR